MTKGLNEQVNEFRNRTLSNTVYPILWVDALYEKVRVDGRIVSMAVVWMKMATETSSLWKLWPRNPGTRMVCCFST